MTKTVKGALAKKVNEGFSLVELMVVVTIIGVLAGIAVPKFQTFRARAVQTEGKSLLNGVYLSMQAYEANYNTLPTIATAIDPNTAKGAQDFGFRVQGNLPKYQLRVITDVANNSWAAAATTTATLANNSRDVVRINANKWICNPFDAVTNQPATAETADFVATAAAECPESLKTAPTAVHAPVLQANDRAQ